MKRLTLNEAADFLRENDGYIILTHARPDGDTIGSAAGLCLGLRSIGKQAYVARNPEVVGRFELIAGHLTPPDGFVPQTVVAVDTATASLFPKNMAEYADKVALLIDHHPSNIPYSEYLLNDPERAAAGELIASLLGEMKIELTQEIASALYVALITDTGGFRFGNTTGGTLRVAADLMDAGIDAAAITHGFFGTKTLSRFALESELLRDVEQRGKVAIMFLTLEKLEKTKATYDDVDGISSLVKKIEGVEIGITLREEKDGSIKTSVRTSTSYAADAICGKLGGGGHARASGASMKNCGMAEARERILGAVYELYPEVK